MSFHRAAQNSTEPPRVIPNADHYDRSQRRAIAPGGQYTSFVLGSRHRSRNLFDASDPKRAELPNGLRGTVFIRNTTTKKLDVDTVGWVSEHCDSRRNPVRNQVGSFKRACAVRVRRDHDHVST
jgi:hypothetical protein